VIAGKEVQLESLVCSVGAQKRCQKEVLFELRIGKEGGQAEADKRRGGGEYVSGEFSLVARGSMSLRERLGQRSVVSSS
jgi:hypothetical protein